MDTASTKTSLFFYTSHKIKNFLVLFVVKLSAFEDEVKQMYQVEPVFTSADCIVVTRLYQAYPFNIGLWTTNTKKHVCVYAVIFTSN